MNLIYYKEKTVDNVRYQFAHPTDKFWGAWRRDKAQLANVGISLTYEPDGRGAKIYQVIRASKPSSNDLREPVKVAPYLIRDSAGLKKYQIPAVGGLVASLLSNGFALDASDTGTGKTYTSIKTAMLTNLQPAIVCTKTNIYDWRKVCEIFKVNPVFIFNWESCRGKVFRSGGKVIKISQPANKFISMTTNEYTGKPVYKWHIPGNAKVVIIFDEIHKANGDESSNQNLVRAAQQAGLKIMGLSATICDKLSKLRMLGSLIGLFEYDDFHIWLKEKGCFIDAFDNWDATNEKELMLKISKYIFPNYGVRVRKTEIKGFPKCQNIAKLYDIKKSSIQNKKYAELEKKIKEIEAKKIQGGTFQIAALRMRHRQIAETYKIPLLIELARDHVEAGHSVIIFTCFVATMEAIQKKIKTECVIKGGQSTSDRRRALEDFGADRERIMITNIQAGGTAVDGMQDLRGEFPRIGLIPPVDDAVILKQALGRIDRANSKSPSMNILIFSAGTVEEKVFANVQSKLENIDLINDGDLAESKTFTKE